MLNCCPNLRAEDLYRPQHIEVEGFQYALAFSDGLTGLVMSRERRRKRKSVRYLLLRTSPSIMEARLVGFAAVPARFTAGGGAAHREISSTFSRTGLRMSATFGPKNALSRFH